MSHLNQVILQGRLTRDPELRTTPNQRSVCNVSIAVNRKYRDQHDVWHEECCYVDAEAWGVTASTIGEYFRKGEPILIRGRLKLDQWTRDGQNHSKLRVVVEAFHFVGGGRATRPADEDAGPTTAQGREPKRQPKRPAPGKPQATQRPELATATTEWLPSEDDIPF